MRIAFRVDASRTIGSGHVMRCLSLADAAKGRGAQTLFITRAHEGNLAHLIEARGHDVHLLPLDEPSIAENDPYASWLGAGREEDAAETGSVISRTGPLDWLVVDHYALDARWQKSLRSHAPRIMVIDDLANRPHDCDVLLDQNLIVGMFDRYADIVPAHCHVLLGPHYALLQPDYAEWHSRVARSDDAIKQINLFFGGGRDALLITALEGLAKADGDRSISCDVVCGSAGLENPQLRELAAANPRLTLHGQLDSLAPLLASADLAIGASGATSWERLCLGLPSIVVVLADNQRPIAEGLQRHGFADWIGEAADVTSDSFASAISAAISKAKSGTLPRPSADIVDGFGASRVCAALGVTRDRALSARPARPSDRPSYAPDRDAYLRALRTDGEKRIVSLLDANGSVAGQVAFPPVPGTDASGMLTITRFPYGVDTAEYLAAALSGWKAQSVAKVALHPPTPQERSLEIAFCSDAASWIDPTVARLAVELTGAGHKVHWTHSHTELTGGDICFYLSYGRIVKEQVLAKFANNLVVHASDLPKGKGWSPLTWQILEGRNEIPVSLIEAEASVDSGPIYKKIVLPYRGDELIDELRGGISQATYTLCRDFVHGYPHVVASGVPQEGEGSLYPRRTAKDSQVDVDQTLESMFNLFRTADNDAYPVWFEYRNRAFVLKIHAKE